MRTFRKPASAIEPRRAEAFDRMAAHVSGRAADGTRKKASRALARRDARMCLNERRSDKAGKRLVERVAWSPGKWTRGVA